MVGGQDTVQQGKASFYHDSFHGQETSNGEEYNKNDFTAAHRTMPFGSILLVTNKKNNKSVIVRVNDRGPFKRSRIIDLSYAAATKIGMVPFGVVQVRITPLTYLDSSTLNDVALKDGEIWDCYGNKKKLNDNTIYIWKTESWKHAFYMASSLSLEKNIEVFVKVNSSPEKRSYSLLVTGIDDSKLNAMKKMFLKDGFRITSTERNQSTNH